MTKTTDAITSEKTPQVHIKISEDGEICFWGLDQNNEARLLHLTGNQDLADQCKAMSFNLCG